MKLNRTFLICLAALLVFAVAMQLRVPARFDWKATWSPNDANPFGCQEFDSVLHKSMPKGYKVLNTTFWKYLQKKSHENVLLIYPFGDFDSLFVQNVINLTKRGNKLLLVAKDTYYQDVTNKKVIGFDMNSYEIFNIGMLREELKAKKNVYDSIYWTGKEYPSRNYKVLYQLLDDVLLNTYNGVKWDTLAYVNSLSRDSTRMVCTPIALRRKMNDGELIVAANPLLFTNYGMLEGESQGYIFRLMNYIADRPVVRLTNKELTEADQERQSTPFRAIFQSRQLTWAFYLTLFVLLLFFIFTARRRQRAIPVIIAPRNHTLEFTRLIGTLFYQRHDYVGLLRRKWDLFAAEIRQTVGVDVQALDDDDTLFTRLSEHTGIEYETISKKIKNIRYLVMNDIGINATEMKNAIDDMNEIAEKSR